MITFLMSLFCLLCIFLVLFILIQQGKGNMGLGGLSHGGQELFGGAGGADFFQKMTWFMGSIFMIGALGLTIYKTTIQDSRIKGYQSPLSLEQTSKKTSKQKKQEPQPKQPIQEKK